MRIETEEILAKDCPVDVFVYIPSLKAFLWVDHVDYVGAKVQLIFEETIDETGIVEHVRTLHEEVKIQIVRL